MRRARAWAGYNAGAQRGGWEEQTSAAAPCKGQSGPGAAPAARSARAPFQAVRPPAAAAAAGVNVHEPPLGAVLPYDVGEHEAAAGAEGGKHAVQVHAVLRGGVNDGLL